jgi:hypothetical protein
MEDWAWQGCPTQRLGLGPLDLSHPTLCLRLGLGFGGFWYWINEQLDESTYLARALKCYRVIAHGRRNVTYVMRNCRKSTSGSSVVGACEFEDAIQEVEW